MSKKDKIISYLFSIMKLEYDEKNECCYMKIKRHDFIEFEKYLDEVLMNTEYGILD